MKKILFLLTILLCQHMASQTFSTNLTPVGWEHNILFNATTRYTVTQQGPAQNLAMMFDGSMNPNYVAGLSTANPTVILIEGLPGYHTQSGAWVGWTTRYLPAIRFKIEGYDEYLSANVWRVISDYSSFDYVGTNFSIQVPSGAYTKLKFTFYEGTYYGGLNGNTFGLSELFFIHPEATTPYAGLLASSVDNWQNRGANLVYNSGNVGVGTSTPGSKLTVAGNIAAREVKVTVDAGADFVFENDYKLPSLESVEEFIIKNNHLPGIASAEEMQQDGINLSIMNIKLLQKIEELTLYSIKQSKEIQMLKKGKTDYKILETKLDLLQKEINDLKAK